MVPKRFISVDSPSPAAWEELGSGAPTILGLARLCSNALASGTLRSEGLSTEAKAILYAARQRGVIEIKASNNAFDAVDRFLAVHVELDGDTGLVFKDKSDPARTMQFLDAFRELCAAGLVLHQLNREFSLSHPGFRLAATIREQDVAEALAFAVELGRHEW